MELFDIALQADDAEFHAQSLAWLQARIGFDGVVWGRGLRTSDSGLSINRSLLDGRPSGLVTDYPRCAASDPVSVEFLESPGKLQNISTLRFYKPTPLAPICGYLDHYRVRQLQLAGMRHPLTQEYSWIVLYREEVNRPFLLASERASHHAMTTILLAEHFRCALQEQHIFDEPNLCGGKPLEAFDFMTHRQRSVLHYLGKGWPNKLIARHLAISENTLKTHLKAIFRLLKVTSRSQAIIVSKKNELLRTTSTVKTRQ